MDLEPNEQALLDQQNALVEQMKIDKTFIDESEEFERLPVEDQEDYRLQYYFMVKYSNALQVRIDKLGI